MNVAVDTNVFVRLLSGDEETVLILQKAVEAAAARGPLVVSPIVYAELAAGRDYRAVDDFFSAKDIEVDWQQGPEVWREAGTRYGRYARDRRRQRGDPGPRRILADFLAGRTRSMRRMPCSPRIPGSSPTTSRSFVSSPRRTRPRNTRSKKGATTIAISNRDQVGRGLETLRAGLAPFVEREQRTRDWQAQGWRGSRYEIRRRV